MRIKDMVLPKGDKHNRQVNALAQLLGSDALAVAVELSASRRRAVDVAAHVGVHSLALVERFNRVEAFEPQSACFDCLRSNVDNWRVTLRRIGLCAALCEAYVNARTTGDSLEGAFAPADRLSQPERKQRQRVPGATLDSFGWTDVDLLRIGPTADLEDVIAGAAATLAASAPVIWITLREKINPRSRIAADALLSGPLVSLGYGRAHLSETNLVLAPRRSGAPLPPAKGVHMAVHSSVLDCKALVVSVDEACATDRVSAVVLKRVAWPAETGLVRGDCGPVPILRIDVNRSFPTPATMTPRLRGCASSSRVGPDRDLAEILERATLTTTSGGLAITLPLEAAAVAEALAVELRPRDHGDARVIFRRDIAAIENIDRIAVRFPPEAIRPCAAEVSASLSAGANILWSRTLEIDLARLHVAPDLVTCYRNRGGGGNRAVEAMARSLGAPLRYAEDGPAPGVAVVWGVLRGSKDVIDAVAKAGGVYYYIDHAYFDRGHGRSYRITRNRFEAGPVRAAPDDRIRQFGVDLQPWRRGGRHILVCPPTDHFMAAHGCADWLDATLAQLARSSDRPVVVRAKPKPGETGPSLAEALHDAHALVTHSSNVAVESAVLGVPVFVSPSSAAAPVGRTDLAAIETPVYPDRAPWLAHLAYNQFTLAEMESGLAWRLLVEMESRPRLVLDGAEATHLQS